jgi:hypothetical protein
MKPDPEDAARWTRRTFLAALALPLLPDALHARCKDKPKKGEVKVSVVGILATEADKEIDPKLDSVAREVQKVHPHLTGFRMAKMTCKPIAVDATETFEVHNGQKATVTVRKGSPGDAEQVELTIKPPSLG